MGARCLPRDRFLANTDIALAETEERYRSLAELSPEPVAVHSGDCVVYANPPALELLGAASGDDVLGRPIFDFVHLDFRGLVAERIHKMEVVGDPAAPVAETLLRVDGSPVEVELAAMPTVWRGRPAVQLTGRALASEALRVASTLVAQAAASLPGRRGGLRVRTWTRELDADEPARLRSEGVRGGRFATLQVTALGPDTSGAPRARLFDPAFAETFPGCGPASRARSPSPAPRAARSASGASPPATCGSKRACRPHPGRRHFRP